MGYIKEPAGIDFLIKSRPLTKAEEIGISEYIRAYKAKHARQQAPTKQTKRKITRKKTVL